MVLLERTIYGFSGKNTPGLLASQSKTWLADKSFWQSWVKESEPHPRLLAESIKWVCMKKEPVWGNETVNEKLTAALDTCFSVAPRYRHNLCHAVHSSRTIFDKQNGNNKFQQSSPPNYQGMQRPRNGASPH